MEHRVGHIRASRYATSLVEGVFGWVPGDRHWFPERPWICLFILWPHKLVMTSRTGAVAGIGIVSVYGQYGERILLEK